MPSGILTPRPAFLALHPRALAAVLLPLSSTTIVFSLLLTQYYPGRFRIHPLPYLSDAGLRDPERILLSLGLALSSALFLPIAAGVYLRQRAHARGALRIFGRRVACARLPRLGLAAAVGVAASLTTFTTVPGWWKPHHVFAGVFAASAATWCFCHAAVSHEVAGQLSRRVRLLYALVGLQVGVVAVFAVTWTSVKLQIPYKMIPNKDPRFIVLAIGEYVGTTAFLTFIGIAAAELRETSMVLTLRTGKEKLHELEV